MSIYETAVRKPITTALIYVAIAVLGLFALSRLSIELMPKTETTNVMVVTSYPGASAADIETNISKPLENSLQWYRPPQAYYLEESRTIPRSSRWSSALYRHR